MRASMGSLVLALGLLGSPAVWADTTTCLSGFEVSFGHTEGDTTVGVTFAGTDSPPVNGQCKWTTSSLGGAWYASINRQGPAGIGGEVTVTGGRWLWDRADGTLFRGRVRNLGSVTWPDSVNEDIGCGPGVGRIAITLTVGGHPGGGSFVGCLDDTHLNPFQPPFVFPPHIWGLLTISG